MPGKPLVDILLATYNGGQYLDEQLRSLFAQTYANMRIVARDDASSDNTSELLFKWAKKYPEKLVVISDELGNLRWRANFSRLMDLSDAPYFALCDQDDVWLPNKVETLLTYIQGLESKLGGERPILVHSDLAVVDVNLNRISPSLFRYWNVDIHLARRLDHLIINNVVVGCSLAGNRALLGLARPIPTNALAHDWWLALVAASCGAIETIPTATILYRQHGANQLGAGRQKGNLFWDARHILQRPLVLQERMKRALALMRGQAFELLHLHGVSMSRQSREFLEAFCLPQFPELATGHPWLTALRLRARVPSVYAFALARALRWCM